MFDFKKIILLSLCFFCLLGSNVKAAEFANFLTLADIHFDPFTSCEKTSRCVLIQKLQNAPANQWATILAKDDKEGPQYREDTNYPLLVSSLQEAKRVAEEKQAQFVVILGDLIGHDFRYYYRKFSHDKSRAGYQSFMHKMFAFLYLQLAQTFPTKDVYFVVGNNDSYLHDYEAQAGNSFYREQAVLFGQLIKSANRQKMQSSFSNAGYYAVDIPQQPNIRLIILNSNFFSYKAKGKHVDATAQQQLNWLQRELQSVRSQNQMALIFMHIPERIDFYTSLRFRLLTLWRLWKTSYIDRFQTLLNTYSTNINGLMTGHLHIDAFQMITLPNGREIPWIGVPSISPIFSTNPGFKVISYSPTTRKLENFITYYYSLNDHRALSMQFGFKQIYQTNCHDCPIYHEENNDHLNASGAIANYYHSLMTTQDEESGSNKWYPYYWCSIWQFESQNDYYCK